MTPKRETFTTEIEGAAWGIATSIWRHKHDSILEAANFVARALTEERRRALRDFLRVIDCTSSNPIDYAAAIAALRREAEGA